MNHVLASRRNGINGPFARHVGSFTQCRPAAVTRRTPGSIGSGRRTRSRGFCRRCNYAEIVPAPAPRNQQPARSTAHSCDLRIGVAM